MKFDELDTRPSSTNRSARSCGVRKCGARMLAGTFVACLLIVAGCGSDSGGDSGGGTGWTVGDSGTDVGVDGGTSGGSSDGTSDVGPPGEPLSTTVRLENRGESSVFIETSNGCELDHVWVDLKKDGEVVSADGSCGLCTCEDLEEEGTCAVCGAAPCRSDVETKEISPGEDAEWTWNGTYFAQEEVDGRTCEREVTPTRGESFSVEVCWQQNAGTPDPDGRETKCDTLEFEYGDDQVEKIVRPGGDPEPVETQFELRNDTDKPVFVQSQSICAPSETEWLSLHDGETRVDMETGCTVCSCSDAEDGGCAVCEIACRPGSIDELPAHSSKTLTWDGLGHRRAERNDFACHERWVPRRGEEITARFCWGDDESLENVECRNASFEYGVDTSISETIEAETGPVSEATISIENQSGETIRVKEIDECDANPPGWMTARHDGDQVDVASDCRDCLCSSVREHGACAVCDRPCRQDSTRTLDPNERTEWTWPGYVYETGEVDGNQCLEQNVPEIGTTYDVEICWQVPAGADTPAFTTKCTTETLLYGQAAAEHIVQ